MDEAPWLSLMSAEELEEHTAGVAVISLLLTLLHPTRQPLCSKYLFLYLIFRDKNPFLFILCILHAFRIVPLDPIHPPIPLYLPPALATRPLCNKIKLFKRKKLHCGSCNVTQ